MGVVLPRVCHVAGLLVTPGESMGSLWAPSSVAPPGVLGQTATLNSAQQHAQPIGCIKTTGYRERRLREFDLFTSSPTSCHRLPCASNFQQCISACGVAEFQALS